MTLLPRMLLRLVPYRWRESVEGDLIEDIERRTSERGRASITWLVSHTAGLIAPLVWSEVRLYFGTRQGLRRHDLATEFRLSARYLLKHRSYTIGVLFNLGFGMAAAAVALSLIDAAFFRPYPGIQDQDQLLRVRLVKDARTREPLPITAQQYEALQAQLSSLGYPAAYRLEQFTFIDGGTAKTLRGALVSPNFFDALGLGLQLGSFAVSHQVPGVVISDRLWRDHFGASLDVLGYTVTLSGTESQIAGIAPKQFAGIDGAMPSEDIWLVSRRVDNGEEPVMVLLRSGQSRRIAGTLLTAPSLLGILNGTRAETPLLAFKPLMRNEPAAGTALWLIILPLLVVLLACVNTSNLVLANSLDRWKHWRTCFALGATRSRLIRQKLTEDSLLALASGVLALCATAAVVGWMKTQVPLDLQVERRVVIASLALAVTTPFLFGLLPALRLTSWSLKAPFDLRMPPALLRPRAMRWLIAGQTALVLCILGTAAQFLATISAREGEDGIRQLHNTVATIDVVDSRLDRRATDALFADILKDFSTVPEVSAVSQSCDCQLWGRMSSVGLAKVWTFATPPEQPHRTLAIFADSMELINSLGLRLLRGEPLPDAGGKHIPRGVLVNEAFADAFLNGGGLGELLQIEPVDAPTRQPSSDRRHEVIGVVSLPINHLLGTPATLRHDRRPTIFAPAPLTHLPVRKVYLSLRGEPSPELRQMLAARLAAHDPRIILRDFASFAELRRRDRAPRQAIAHSVSVIGALLLLIAAGGLFTFLSYLVARSKRDIAIRMALGADPTHITLTFMRRALHPALLGCGIGAVLATGAGLLIRSSLYGASPFDASTFGAASLLLLFTMALASSLPATRAARTAPSDVLRAE